MSYYKAAALTQTTVKAVNYHLRTHYCTQIASTPHHLMANRITGFFTSKWQSHTTYDNMLHMQQWYYALDVWTLFPWRKWKFMQAIEAATLLCGHWAQVPRCDCRVIARHIPVVVMQRNQQLLHTHIHTYNHFYCLTMSTAAGSPRRRVLYWKCPKILNHSVSHK